MPVESHKPISEEDTFEEECEDEMITVTPFAIEPDNEVIVFFFYIYKFNITEYIR